MSTESTSRGSLQPVSLPDEIRDNLIKTKGKSDRFSVIATTFQDPEVLKAYSAWAAAHSDVIAKYDDMKHIDSIAKREMRKLELHEISENEDIIAVGTAVAKIITGVSKWLNSFVTPQQEATDAVETEHSEVAEAEISEGTEAAIARVKEAFLEYDMGIISLEELKSELLSRSGSVVPLEDSDVLEHIFPLFEALSNEDLKNIVMLGDTEAILKGLNSPLITNAEKFMPLLERFSTKDLCEVMSPPFLVRLTSMDPKDEELPRTALYNPEMLKQMWPLLVKHDLKEVFSWRDNPFFDPHVLKALQPELKNVDSYQMNALLTMEDSRGTLLHRREFVENYLSLLDKLSVGEIKGLSSIPNEYGLTPLDDPAIKSILTSYLKKRDGQ